MQHLGTQSSSMRRVPVCHPGNRLQRTAGVHQLGTLDISTQVLAGEAAPVQSILLQGTGQLPAELDRHSLRVGPSRAQASRGADFQRRAGSHEQGSSEHAPQEWLETDDQGATKPLRRRQSRWQRPCQNSPACSCVEVTARMLAWQGAKSAFHPIRPSSFVRPETYSAVPPARFLST